MDSSDESIIYDVVGGDTKPFHDLVEAFYARVEADSPLRALYPQDLNPGKQRLTWFLVQRFGGPELFNENRGAPVLRQRHAGFAVTRAQAGRWLRAMRGAIDSVPALGPHKDALARYFTDAAVFLINTDDGRAELGLTEAQSDL